MKNNKQKISHYLPYIYMMHASHESQDHTFITKQNQIHCTSVEFKQNQMKLKFHQTKFTIKQSLPLIQNACTDCSVSFPQLHSYHHIFPPSSPLLHYKNHSYFSLKNTLRSIPNPCPIS